MKKLLFVIAIILSCQLNAQITQYTVNGNAYSKGNEITLNNGSGINNTFRFIQSATLLSSEALKNCGDANKFTVGSDFTGVTMKIKKIRLVGGYGGSVVYFIVKWNKKYYYIFVEEAAKAGEI